MSIFNRITATLTSTVDKAVSHVENHDAVVEATLKDTRTALAKAKVRLSRVVKDGESLHQKLDELKRMETTWAKRAKSIAENDEQKALDCVQRRNMCRDQAVQISASIKNHQDLESKVGESVSRMEQRLSELTQQRNMMRSRHSAADAMRVISKIENNSANGIDDTFDRWEMLITETEYTNGSYTEVDSLDASFAKNENTGALKADLEELLNDEEYDLENYDNKEE